MGTSEKWRLDWADMEKWTKNTMLFLVPVLVLYLGSVVANINLDGFSWSDFALNDVIVGSMVLYVLNTILDLLRKFTAAPKVEPVE